MTMSLIYITCCGNEKPILIYPIKLNLVELRWGTKNDLKNAGFKML